MSLALQIDRPPATFSSKGGAHTAYLLDEAATLAHRAEGAFDSRAELKDWLACAVAQRLRGAPRCGKGQCAQSARLACAMRFKGACPFAMQPRELDNALSRLPTGRLQALMRLERDARQA